MAFIKQQVEDQAIKHAAQAIKEGRTVYVAKLMEQIISNGLSGPMGRVSDQIQAIEALGWTLDQMSACEAKVLTIEHAGVVCLFRRAA